jgi:hypothetical protein
MAEISNRSIPVKRNNLFFGEKDFRFFENVGMEYSMQVMNMSVVLYRINRTLSGTDSLYGETMPGSVKYEPPLEINCRYTIDQSQNRAYVSTNNSARYRQVGNIEVHVFDVHLEQLGADIKYGDIIGVSVREDIFIYYEVIDDGKRNWSNQETMFGYKPLYRTVIACELDPGIFSG